MADFTKSPAAAAGTSKSGQWKLIAVLIAILAALNVFGGSDEDSEVLAGPSSADVANSESADNPAADVRRREIPWPEVPLEFVLTNNPFSRNSRFTPETAMVDQSGNVDTGSAEDATALQSDNIDSTPLLDSESLSMATSALAGKKLRLVFRSARGNAAMIDSKVYHEGDRIDQFEIAKIDRDRVTLRVVANEVIPSP